MMVKAREEREVKKEETMMEMVMTKATGDRKEEMNSKTMTTEEIRKRRRRRGRK